MLYLVEYAHWNSQAKIGYGGGLGSIQNVGLSDTMPYHTGTMQSSRTSYGVGIQYRYIEDWWANIQYWIDGIYFSGSDVYCIKNPADFSDSTGGTLTGQRSTTLHYIKAWNNPAVLGFEYSLFPITVDSSLSDSTYITDTGGGNGQILYCGGSFYQSQYNGAFMLSSSEQSTAAYDSVGCHLMVLPSSRLS